MPKLLVYGDEARKKMQGGVDKIAQAVKTTLGPKGRNVALDKKWGAPDVTHDGVTVAKEIELKDPFENMGAQLLKEAASKPDDDSSWFRKSGRCDCVRTQKNGQTNFY